MPTGPGISALNFLGVPEDLNAEELERYLREYGAEICNLAPRGHHDAVPMTDEKIDKVGLNFLVEVV